MGMNRIEHIFTERFVPLYPRLYSAACAILGDRRGDAQDAVQEAMVRIWRSGDAMASMQNPEVSPQNASTRRMAGCTALPIH